MFNLELPHIIKNNNFAKNILLISGGTIIAQATNTLFSPLLTRIYTPDQFGVLTVYTSLLSILSVTASLRYEWAIPIADDKKKAINALVSSLIILFSVVFVITILINLASHDLFNAVSLNSLYDYKNFIPAGVFFVGLYNIFVQWAYRNKDYRNLSKTKILQSITQNFMKLLLGFLGLGNIGLITGRILGQSAGVAMITKSIRHDFPNFKSEVSFKDVIWTLKRYKNFAIYSTPGQLLNSAGVQLPVFLLATLFNSNVVGYYGLANTIVSLPMTLIGMSVADVYYSEIANLKSSNPSKIKHLTKKLLIQLTIIGLIPLVLLIITGPYLFSTVFGQEWVIAGVYARLIAPLVYVRLVFTPFSRIFAVFERQRLSLFIDVLRIAIVIIIFVFAQINNFDSYETILIYSAGMMIVYLFTFLVSYKIIKDL